MIRLLTLGTTELAADEGSPVAGTVVSQPKRLALLTYLAVARPGGRCFRDTLLALLWPELDWDRARHALRQTLYHLRRELGPDVVLGEDQAGVGIDEARLWCDAVAFEREIAADRLAQALALYDGEFLPGFHPQCGPGYDLWLDTVRMRLQTRAEHAGWTLMDRAEDRGDVREACRWAHRVVALQPYSERARRRLIRLLAASGQRVEALHSFEAFASRLQREEGLDPEKATLDLAAAVRRNEPAELLGDGAHRRHDAVPARPSPPERTVAVLPFTAFSGCAVETVFADGLTELVILGLVRSGGLSVLSRTSVQRYRQATLSLPSIARELDVQFILEGSVLISDGALRVTAQLLAAVPERHLWAESFARAFDDSFSIQAELADLIAEKTAAALLDHVPA